MLILHVAAIKKRDTAVFLWAEADEKDRSQGKRKSSWGWLSGRKHPCRARIAGRCTADGDGADGLLAVADGVVTQ